jgi:peptidoglycan hydrolase-like protein with peptidoglycan-binding domain
VGGVLLARADGGEDEPDGTASPTVPTTVTPPPSPTPPPTATPTPPPPPSPPAAPVELPEGVTLRPGAEGDDVRAVQQALAQLGYDVGEVDGIYGTGTEAAVTAFQEASGLTADGVAGPETIDALRSALEAG